uniref:Uncharacterized protein n=1 Tax=Acrobeloides nanus TaxID=290746 RepID=A0A914DI68_9BILA
MCGTYQNSAFDTTTQRWTKYADCLAGMAHQTGHIRPYTINYDEYAPIQPGSTADSQCALMGREAAKYTFAMQNMQRSNWFYYETTYGPDYFVPSSYIGLHRNSQNSLMWYDYDGSEFPVKMHNAKKYLVTPSHVS